MDIRVGTSVVGPGGRRYRVARIDKVFNPAQPRAPAGEAGGGRWISGGSRGERAGHIVLYHGTTAAAVADIARDGLVPGGGVGADTWLAAAAEMDEDAAEALEAIVGGRPVSVFFAKSPKGALEYARLTAEFRESEPVLLKIKVPKAEATALLLPDTTGGRRSRSTVRAEQRIPPEWIEVAVGEAAIAGRLGKVGGIELYGVLLCAVTEKAYDPAQPRDQIGRWTRAGGGAVPDGGLREYLEFVVSHQGAERQAKSADAFILKHGRAMPMDAESFVGGGTPQQCYENAALAVLADDDLTYVEGYVSVHGVPIAHAWAINAEGVVRDPTFAPEGIGGKPRTSFVKGYFGVPIQTAFLEKTLLRSKYYGILVGSENPKTVQSVLSADPAESIAKAYDPSQPRDQIGRWTAAGGAGFTSPLDQAQALVASRAAKLARARAAAEEMGFDPTKVLEGAPGKTFELGGRTYQYAGAAYETGQIEVFPDAIADESTIPGLMAHEIMHQRFNAFERRLDAERARLAADSRSGGDHMAPDGTLRAGVAREYPVYSAYIAATGGAKWETMKERDGVTDYSRAYWSEWNKGNVSSRAAVHETLAEMARLGAETGVRPGGREWNDFFRAVVKYGKLE
jgi:hypothetical protein